MVGLYAAATASTFALGNLIVLPGILWFSYRTQAALQEMDRLSPARRLVEQNKHAIQLHRDIIAHDAAAK